MLFYMFNNKTLKTGRNVNLQFIVGFLTTIWCLVSTIERSKNYRQISVKFNLFTNTTTKQQFIQ